MQFDSALSVFDYLLDNYEHDITQGLKELEHLPSQLIQEVESLAQAYLKNKQNTSFRSTIAAQSNTLDLDANLTNLCGQVFQPFKLKQLIGAGGMGVVYLAERCDGHFEQQVAIKIIAPSITAITSREQALKEAQHLARLNHPNIAKIFDVGSTDEGLVYLVMEYIKGASLISTCSALSTVQVVSLFIKVCDAVRYSHQNRIIHGDIKPDNIIVDALGEPKLLDFGVAHTLSEKSDSTYSAYINGLSSDYASPEQLDGLPLTTHSDVFSLGKVLAAMLRKTDGELEAVLKKATAWERKTRFASVELLIANLQSYHQNRPITWYRNDIPYRLGKQFKRTPLAFSLSTLAVGLLLTITFQVIDNQQARLAHAEEQQGLLNFYQSLLASFAPAIPQGDHFTTADLLAYGAKQADTSLLPPKSRKEVKQTLAKSLYVHGYYERALQVLNSGADSDSFIQLKALILLKLERSEELQSMLAGLPTGKQKKELSWLMIDTPNAVELRQLMKFFDSAPLTELTLLILKRAVANKWLPDHQLLALIDTLKARKLTIRENIWLDLFVINIKAHDADKDLEQQLVSLISRAENTFHPIHSELAAIHLMAADAFANLKVLLNQERSMNQATYILEQLAPFHQQLLMQALLAQYNYYLNENDLYQARAFLSRAYDLCDLTDPVCSSTLYNLIQLRAELGEATALQQDAQVWLQHNSDLNEKYFDVWLAYQASIKDDSSATLTLPEGALKVMTDEQLTHWLLLLTKYQRQLTTQPTEQVLERAKESPKLAHQLLEYVELNNHTELLSASDALTLTKVANKYDHEAIGFSLFPSTPPIYAKKLVNVVATPKASTTMEMGSAYEITWDSSKLPGNKLNLFINHDTYRQEKSYQNFSNIKTIRWKHAASNIENDGKFSIDPYEFMANGADKFKILLASELGYWSLSDGLFSISSGVAKDNGLEHFFKPDLLVDVITYPKAFDIYTVGKTSEITWDHNAFRGKYLHLYVLHDDAKGIGSGNNVDVETVYNKRWYLFARHIENTGQYQLDPALFNGRGNNYKILMISDLGYWSVSEERFSVLNHR